MDNQLRELLRRIHGELAAEDPEKKRPSPWFGKIYERVFSAAREAGLGIIERESVYTLACQMGLSFRSSGDWSEMYRTIYHCPTQADFKLLESLSSRKLAALEPMVDKNQIPMFEGA
jgi:hypothetical protein